MCPNIPSLNTSASKLVYDYISGFYRANADGTTQLENGRLALFLNFDEHGNPIPRPSTLLIDSEQLESGEALDDNFRNFAGPEIEQLRRDMTGSAQPVDNPVTSFPAGGGVETMDLLVSGSVGLRT